MKTKLTAAIFSFWGIALAMLFSACSDSPVEEGWTNLLSNGIQDWERYPFPATRPLVEKSPWSYDAQTGILRCEATKIHEMLLYKTPFGNGTLHVEWRYIGNPQKNNSGIFIRTAPDTSSWAQAQLATSGLGILFGNIPDTTNPQGKGIRKTAGKRTPELQCPPGEWNTAELSAQGDTITLTINGKLVATMDGYSTLSGSVGLEAEFYPIEFRNIRYKAEK